ncbi:MAG TPA: hypothetical protein VLZ05_18585, partial [Mycobacterium sp.]|nr:hypothetical protein [Mycobacterium sp.]
MGRQAAVFAGALVGFADLLARDARHTPAGAPVGRRAASARRPRTPARSLSAGSDDPLAGVRVFHVIVD